MEDWLQDFRYRKLAPRKTGWNNYQNLSMPSYILMATAQKSLWLHFPPQKNYSRDPSERFRGQKP